MTYEHLSSKLYDESSETLKEEKTHSVSLEISLTREKPTRAGELMKTSPINKRLRGKDSQQLAITTTNEIQIAIIDQITAILFKRQNGLDALLPKMADTHQDCPMLQFYAAIMYFFSFSQKLIQDKFPTYLSRIDADKLNARELIYFSALNFLLKNNFSGALKFFQQITTQFPQDKVAILMLETCGFLCGQVKILEDSYKSLFEIHGEDPADPNFLGMVAFVYCHLNKTEQAKKLIIQGLKIDPHNTWLQHIYAHTLADDTPKEKAEVIAFLEKHTDDWPKQNRFFEGHNWMHLCVLYLRSASPVNFKSIQKTYTDHIWGLAKEFNFEQNNAFLVLWNAELCGHKVPEALWHELAAFATPFLDDYFTPYLTITAILSVARVDMSKAIVATTMLERHISHLPESTESFFAWNKIGLPILRGCLEYIQGNYTKGKEYLEAVCDHTEVMGHSNEQREIFPMTLKKCKEASTEKLLTQESKITISSKL